MKLSVFIGGIMAIALSFMSVLLLSSFLPGQAISYTAPIAMMNGLTSQDPLSGWSVAYFQGFAFPEPKPVSVGLPARLKIPGINVDAIVEYVGLTADGAMDVPKSQEHVAWFELGQRPGENGSAVIAGHYGRKGGRASVFDNLYKLRTGDTVNIEDDKGATISFVVRSIRRYDAAADATDVFSSDDGKAHLNLITCEGSWDKSAKQYPSRLVVFADKK